MSQLIEIQGKLLDTGEALARMERALHDNPGARSPLLTNIQSLQKRQRDLEKYFIEEAARLEIDVCSYRLLSPNGRATIGGLSRILGEFQTLVSLVYDALKTGMRKQRATYGAESANETAFAFGYTYAGSLGIVLTLPNQRLLPTIETRLDEAIRLTFDMVKIDKPASLLDLSRKIGVAPVQRMYQWASAHVASELDAEIEWRRKDAVKSRVLVQRPELVSLQQIIAVTSEEEKTEVTVVGELVGADVESNTFHLKVQGADYRGYSEVAIGPKHTVELPKPYKATIRTTTKVHYATEQEDVSHTLLALEPL